MRTSSWSIVLAFVFPLVVNAQNGTQYTGNVYEGRARTVDGWNGQFKVIYADSADYGNGEWWKERLVAEGDFTVMDNSPQPNGQEMHFVWPKPSSIDEMTAAATVWQARIAYSFTANDPGAGGGFATSCTFSGAVGNQVSVSALGSEHLGFGGSVKGFDASCTYTNGVSGSPTRGFNGRSFGASERIPLAGFHIQGATTDPETKVFFEYNLTPIGAN